MIRHTSPLILSVCHAVGGSVQQLAVNDQALRRAWESSQRSTKEDWAEWMRNFAVELLKESPSHALRATHLLAQVPHCNYTHPALPTVCCCNTPES
jgi:hypothetical protein